MEHAISIHLAPGHLGTFFGLPITNTLLSAWLAVLVLLVFAVLSTRRLKLIPGKGQVVLEALVALPYRFVEDTLGSARLAQTVFPIVMTIFLFTLVANWTGLLPWVGAFGTEDHGHLVPWLYPANTDLNMTLALAVIAFLTIEFLGIATLGFFRYAGKFLNFSSPIALAVGVMELISEVARLISFSFRLFGNVFAGKVLLLVVMAFVPYILPVPILALEVMVGFIQAAIFAILTLFFVKIAVEDPHGSEQH